MAKISLADIVAQSEGIKGFPKVVVDQTNVRISDIIKRNLAGEQILGETHLSYDYTNSDQKYDPEKVNPFSRMGFDLDDVIQLAAQTGQQISDLQNQYGELKAKAIAAQKEVKDPVATSATTVVSASEPDK